MDEEATRARIRQFAEAINTADMEVFDAIYHDDVVIEWPSRVR
jgi:ketosteroid isomerase-like protein